MVTHSAPSLMVHAETDAQRWNAALASLPAHHVLQSWEWGEIKRQTGWWAHRLLFTQQGAIVAAAQVLTRRLGRAPLAVQYTPKGPALDYADPALTVQVLAALEDYARRSRAIFIKMDPDVPDDTARGRAILDLLRQRGWQAAAEQVQFKNTALLDLAAGEEAVLAGFKQKWRYNVRLAGRKGVTVRRGSTAELETFYRLYAETGARDGFLIRPLAYYRDAWQTLLNGQGQVGGCLLLADVGAETVAAIAATRAVGGRVVAVGTTTLRALESAAVRVKDGGALQPCSGETDIFITPGFEFRVVDRLLTNFHLPRSTLLMLVSAFAGHDHVMALYRHAVESRYRFFSYGDAMLLERTPTLPPVAAPQGGIGSGPA